MRFSESSPRMRISRRQAMLALQFARLSMAFDADQLVSSQPPPYAAQ
jgi:hypothetical protein